MQPEVNPLDIFGSIEMVLMSQPSPRGELCGAEQALCLLAEHSCLSTHRWPAWAVCELERLEDELLIHCDHWINEGNEDAKRVAEMIHERRRKETQT